MGRMLHGLAPTSAAIFAEALSAGIVVAALQKEDTRLNLHLQVDGPIAGLLSRAIVLIDADGKLIYTEQVPEIAQEPNYDAALAALK